MTVTEIAAAFPPGTDGEETAQAYLHENGILEVLQSAAGAQENRIQPKYRDLARLHRAVRSRRSICCVEFGVGFSTIVLCDAMRKNQAEWDSLSNKPRIRSAKPFHLFSIDSSSEWIEATRNIIPEALAGAVTFVESGARAGQFQGRLCHFFTQVPDVVPDFLYIDGPDPATVTGDVGGLGWASGERIVMSADLLVMEPGLTPGAMVLIDGRTLNARFLAGHLYRNWSVAHEADTDVTVMELQEAPIGQENEALLQFQLGRAADAWPDPVRSGGAG